MELEILLPIFAVLLLTLDFIQITQNKKPKKTNYGTYATTIAFLLILTSYGLLVAAYVTNDFSLTEVYTYSSSSLPLLSKICASWAGAAGSILFLTLTIVTTYFGYRLATNKNPSPISKTAKQVLCILAIFFVLMNIGKTPFTRLETVPPDGAGLNPALQTPWMMIHPPIVFLGYAFVVLAFALALGGMKTKELTETKLLKVSAGLAWLLLTIGIALGGIWAYEVLGWGGYWSWDPVETGSLLVWLAISAYFFVRPIAENGKTLVKQFTILIAFMALIFLSALTRGGLLRSVHAYALSPAGPILIALAIGFAAYFFYLQKKTAKPILKLRIEKSSMQSTTLAAGYVALAALFLGSFLGVAVPILEQLFTSEPITPGSSFYNTWSFPFTAILVIAMIGYALKDKLTIRDLTFLAIGCIITGAGLALVQWPTKDALSNFGIPLLVSAIAITTFDLVTVVSKKERTLRNLGRKLLFFGMIIGLVGILFSSATKQSTQLQNIQFSDTGTATAQTQDMSLVLRNWVVSGGEGKVYSSDSATVLPERSSLKVNVDVYRDNQVYSDYLQAALYVNYGTISQPLVIHTAQGDIYMHLEVTNELYNSLLQGIMGIQSTTPAAITLTVSTVPYVYLLWAGIIIMCLGITLKVADDIKRKETEDEQTNNF
jgi:c-type cytochrome biogenesis protein CcmF